MAPIDKAPHPPVKIPPPCTSNPSPATTTAYFGSTASVSLTGRRVLNGGGDCVVGCASTSAGSSSRTSDDAIIGGGGGVGDSGDDEEATNISDSDGDDDYEMDDCGRDMTLVDDDDCGYDPNNEGQMMYLQVVEMLREEQEVWKYSGYSYCIAFKKLYVDIHRINR